jgi:Membrane transport protein
MDCAQENRVSARNSFHHLQPHTGDIGHSGIWPRRSRTGPRSNQRRGRGTCSLGNLSTVALAVVVLEIDAAAKNRQTGTDRSQPGPLVTGLKGALKSPLLWGPVLGMAVLLAKVHLPSVVTKSLDLIGSATSGVAIFSVGLVLAAYPVCLSPGVFAGSLARVSRCNPRR